MFNFSSLCPNSKFSLISSDTQTLGECFLATCILAPASLLFLIANFHVLITSPGISRRYESRLIQAVRLLSFTLLFISIVQIYLAYFRDTSREISIEDSAVLTTQAVVQVSLTLHFFNVMNKNVFTKYPIKLLVTFSLFTTASLIQLINRTYLRPAYNSIEFISGSVYCLAEVFYMALALFTFSDQFRTNNPYLFSSLETRVNVQGDDSEFLIHEEESASETEEAASEEDLANYFSYLTFNWLKPVMNK
jgi:hypothetical protein